LNQWKGITVVDEKKPGRLEQLFSGNAQKEREPEKPQSYWARNYALIRRRIITGILFLIPILVTLWFLQLFLGFIHFYFERPLKVILAPWGITPDSVAYKVVAYGMSVLALLILSYLLGLVTARTAVRRLISLVERLVECIPFVKFFYKTTKQIVEIVAMPSKSALKKIVVIEFPRLGVKSLAFATGETPVEGQAEPLVNVFIPTTPNPTSGYLVLLHPSPVWETDLTMEKGLHFIISGGILAPDHLILSPYRSPAPPAASSC
jgi:uncharacterized membrane protein